MATRKTATTGKRKVKKQKSSKATIKNLDAKSKGKDIKGGSQRFDPYKNFKF